MLLKKPNLYLVSWTQKNVPMPGMVQSGAVWSDGTQPYLYMGVLEAYAKIESDQMALASATGISGGVAYTIPSLFSEAFEGRPSSFSRLKDLKMEESEKIGANDCYVISGSSSISKREVLWIAKQGYLIRKYCRSLEPPAGDRKVPAKLKGSVTEVYASVASPKLKAVDFVFHPARHYGSEEVAV